MVEGSKPQVSGIQNWRLKYEAQACSEPAVRALRPAANAHLHALAVGGAWELALAALAASDTADAPADATAFNAAAYACRARLPQRYL